MADITVAGMIATASHGSGVNYGITSDYVRDVLMFAFSQNIVTFKGKPLIALGHCFIEFRIRRPLKGCGFNPKTLSFLIPIKHWGGGVFQPAL